MKLKNYFLIKFVMTTKVDLNKKSIFEISVFYNNFVNEKLANL